MNKDLPYWVATSAIPGVGTSTFDYLLAKFKTLKKFWEASDSAVERLKLEPKTIRSISKFREGVNPVEYLDMVQSKGVGVVCITDRDYPRNLKVVIGAPKVLYYKGSLLQKDNKAIAVVGSRMATPYGRQVTHKFVLDLVGVGFAIVSGMARGIDTVAHKAALLAGGRTIAVLGSGVDVIYPPENRELYGEIIKNGAVVSEFPMGFPSIPANFPARNRIVSGLSKGVLVTEAASMSGSLITAGCAAEQGREVFAVPGPVTSKTSEGTNSLIKEGVHIACDAADILEELNVR